MAGTALGLMRPSTVREEGSLFCWRRRVLDKGASMQTLTVVSGSAGSKVGPRPGQRVPGWTVVISIGHGAEHVVLLRRWGQSADAGAADG